MSAIKKPPLDEANVSAWVWKQWFNQLWNGVENIISSGISLITQEEGVDLSTGVTTLNFVGAGVTAAGAGTTTTVTIPGGLSGIRVEDEGSSIVAAATGMNFAGAGVVVTDAGSNEALVTIAGGSAPASGAGDQMNWGKYIAGMSCWPTGG